MKKKPSTVIMRPFYDLVFNDSESRTLKCKMYTIKPKRGHDPGDNSYPQIMRLQQIND